MGRTGRWIALSLAGVAAATVLTACPAPNSPSKFGVNLFSTVHHELDNDPRVLDAMQGAGFKWASVYLWWPSIEAAAPSNGVYAWNQGYLANERAYFAELNRRGFSIKVFLSGLPGWAIGSSDAWAGCGTGKQVLSAAYFQDFAWNMTTRFKDLVAAWGIWDEPNNNCKYPGTAADFRQNILKPGFDGIRSADPGAIVLAPPMAAGAAALPGLWDNWLTYVTATGVHRLVAPLSALSVNAFGTVADIEASMDAAHSYSRCMAGGNPCMNSYWLTSFGFNDYKSPCWAVDPCPVDPGNATTRVFDHCLAHADCMHALYWSSDYDDYNSNNVQLNALALLDPWTLQPRPKYSTIRDYVLSH